MNVNTDIVEDLTSPRSSEASGSTSPYRRRFNQKTRREALEQRFGRLRGRGGAKSLRQSLKGGSSKDEDDRSSRNAFRAQGASSATSEDNPSFSGSVSSDSNDSIQRQNLNDNSDMAGYLLDGDVSNESDQVTTVGRATFVESRYHFIPIPKAKEAMSKSSNQDPISTNKETILNSMNGRPEKAWALQVAVRPSEPKSPMSTESDNRANEQVETVLVQRRREVIRLNGTNMAETDPENKLPKTERNKSSFVMQRAQELSKMSNMNPDLGRDKEKQKQDEPFSNASSLPKFPISPERETWNSRANAKVGSSLPQPRNQVKVGSGANLAEPIAESKVFKVDRNENSIVMQRARAFGKLSSVNQDDEEKSKPEKEITDASSENLTKVQESKLPMSPERENQNSRNSRTDAKVGTALALQRGETPTESKVLKSDRNENSIVMQRARAFGKLSNVNQEGEEKPKQDFVALDSPSENATKVQDITNSDDNAVLSPRGSLVAQRALAFESITKKIPEPPLQKAAGAINRPVDRVASPNQDHERIALEAKTLPLLENTGFASPSRQSLADENNKSNAEKASVGGFSDDNVLKNRNEIGPWKVMLRPVNASHRKDDTLVRSSDPNKTIYYRIVYRGVVALLSEPSTSGSRSGAYVSYGEFIASRYEVDVDDGESTAFEPPQSPRAPNTRLEFKVRSPGGYFDAGQLASPESPPRSVLSQASASVSSLETSRTQSTTGQHASFLSDARRTSMKAVRVDEVLTGGYAVDAIPLVLEPASETPRRSNIQFGPILGPSPIPIPDSQSCSIQEDAGLAVLSDKTTHMGVRHHGFLFTSRRDLTIAEEVATPPICNRGRFLYKVISSTPLPILTGPCSDAPQTKAMLLPGTMHEVCLKLMHDQEENQICFLRLSHRKGWIPDRKSSLGGPMKLLMVPVENGDSQDSVSVVSKSGASQSSASTRRHRLPRRRHDSENTSFETVSAPGTPARRPGTSAETPRRTVSHVPDQNTPTPSSNLSMLSDDSSIDHGVLNRIAGVISPDRSVAKSSTSTASSTSMIYLMRVTAPQGLKILDAPQFQVNNLIHGKHDGINTLASLHGRDSKSVSYFKTNQSVFQSLASAKGSKSTGSPAVFDSVSKGRKLPRNVFFEASKQMECFEAFNQGLGLIKLADGSGWAIVPRQEELDEQYRKYHGGVAGVKEGEAIRAFEEVGNAVVDHSESTCVWLRVLPKTGLTVSCPPPLPLPHEAAGSPASSSVGGESSSVGGGSNYGLLRDSEVASAVGSAILDAMFRTPKKKDGEASATENHGSLAPPKIIVAGNEDAVLCCGLCVEVERWKDSPEGADSAGISQDFVRLRGGQGWMPRIMKGKLVVAPVEKPDLRIGSFWFRVKVQQGMKVRLGPSHRAKSIKSEDGVYFRFECGEFLRASEVITIFEEEKPSECFAKLYRNRHAQLNQIQHDYKELSQLTVQSEWVQVHGDDRLFLEECAAAPRIERHRQGWRYNVVLNYEVMVRRGPSFAAESTGKILLGGESVLITERVTAPGETMTWLRLKDGGGWVHDFGPNGDAVMIAHSLRDRAAAIPAPQNDENRGNDIAYNAIIARLFHGDGPVESAGPVGLHRTISK